MDPLSSGWEALFFCVGFVLLLISGFEVRVPILAKLGINVLGLGLACFGFVVAWNALAD